jgi:hypothetical protein
MSMSHARELIEVAEGLVTGSEASVRRSISTSYYSAFHELIDRAVVATFQPGRPSEIARRHFEHTAMLKVAKWFEEGDRSMMGRCGLAEETASDQLIAVCRAFRELYLAREKADYELGRARLSTTDARLHVANAKTVVDGCEWEVPRSELDCLLFGIVFRSFGWKRFGN